MSSSSSSGWSSSISCDVEPGESSKCKPKLDPEPGAMFVAGLGETERVPGRGIAGETDSEDDIVRGFLSGMVGERGDLSPRLSVRSKVHAMPLWRHRLHGFPPTH